MFFDYSKTMRAFAVRSRAEEEAYVPNDSEKLFGAWVNLEYIEHPAQKEVFYPDETLSRSEDRTFKPKTPAMSAKITNQTSSINDLLCYKVAVN